MGKLCPDENLWLCHRHCIVQTTRKPNPRSKHSIRRYTSWTKRRRQTSSQRCTCRFPLLCLSSTPTSTTWTVPLSRTTSTICSAIHFDSAPVNDKDVRTPNNQPPSMVFGFVVGCKHKTHTSWVWMSIDGFRGKLKASRYNFYQPPNSLRSIDVPSNN